jgi:hypothetical protein
VDWDFTTNPIKIEHYCKFWKRTIDKLLVFAQTCEKFRVPRLNPKHKYSKFPEYQKGFK